MGGGALSWVAGPDESSWLHALGITAMLLGTLTSAHPAGLASNEVSEDPSDRASDDVPDSTQQTRLLTVAELPEQLLVPAMDCGVLAVRCSCCRRYSPLALQWLLLSGVLSS